VEGDSSTDLNPDVGGDAAPDASRDAGLDARYDLRLDMGHDVGVDLGADAGVAVLAPVLPSPRHESAVFSDGQSVYVAGGLDDKSVVLSQIVRFAPSAGTLAVLPEVLPTPTYAAGVAWTGTAAYLFGGLGSDAVLRQIVRYVPSTGAATIVTARLPVAAYNVGAVWTGSAIYVFGGFAGTHVTQILKYDPANDVLSTLTATLPVGSEAPAVFWDGSVVWILGGKTDAAGSDGVAVNAVQVFDPVSGQASLLGSLPYPVWDAPAFGDGDSFYLAGGYASTTSGYTSILRVDPVARATSTLGMVLPVRLAGRVGTWVSSVAAGYICGGADYITSKPSDEIIQVVP
jgi:hypothetical protein